MEDENYTNISYDELHISSDVNVDHLGDGGFSNVYRCYHHTLGAVAVKIFKSNQNKKTLDTRIKRFKREISLQQAACSEYIVKVLGMMQYQRTIGIVLEYMSMGSLEMAICDAEVEKVPWSFKVRALYETASALNYLHNLEGRKRITHNDIKPANILLTADLHVKVSDFGGATLSQYTSLNHSVSNTNTEKSEHTISYAAPELLNNVNMERTWSMDVHSFSLVIYFITFQYHPFEGKSEAMVSHAIKTYQTPIAKEDRIQCGNDKEIRALEGLKKILQWVWENSRRPDKRPRINSLMQQLGEFLNMFSKETAIHEISKFKEMLLNDRSDNDASSQEETRNRITIIERILRESHYYPEDSSTVINLLVPQQPASAAEHTNTHDNDKPQSASVQILNPDPTPSSFNTTDRHRDFKSKDSLAVTNLVDLQQPSSAEKCSNTQDNDNTQTESVQILNLFNPFLNQGDDVLVTCNPNSAAYLKSHYDYDITPLVGKCGKIQNTGITSEGFYQISINGESHSLQEEYLQKLCSSNEFLVGDVVKISLPGEIIQSFQDGHGNWNEEMAKHHGEPGIIFRFIPNSYDVLVVYRDGSYFRFNPDALQISSSSERHSHLTCKSTANPSLSVGDYVTHHIADEDVKNLQKHYGGWNEDMKKLQDQVGKLIYIDYRDRAYIAYSSKHCFIFNPVIFTSVSLEEAIVLKTENASRSVQNAKQYCKQYQNDLDFIIGDPVKVCLPAEAYIQLQKEQGGWCYQMMDVYGKRGIVESRDRKNNLQVIFDNGSIWSLNPVSVVPYNTKIKNEYKPLFMVEERVKIAMDELSGVSENQILQAIRQLNISTEKAKVLTTLGRIVGMNDRLEYIVEYDSGMKYAIDERRIVKI